MIDLSNLFAEGCFGALVDSEKCLSIWIASTHYSASKMLLQDLSK